MKHDHNHRCTCEHETVKFCKHCHTVYCVGCAQEWSYQFTWSYSQPSQWPYTTSATTAQTILNQNIPTPTTVTCSHGV